MPHWGDRMERRFLLPDLYFTVKKKETFKKFAVAYIKDNHRGWKPVRFEGRYVICEYIGD